MTPATVPTCGQVEDRCLVGLAFELVGKHAKRLDEGISLGGIESLERAPKGLCPSCDQALDHPCMCLGQLQLNPTPIGGVAPAHDQLGFLEVGGQQTCGRHGHSQPLREFANGQRAIVGEVTNDNHVAIREVRRWQKRAILALQGGIVPAARRRYAHKGEPHGTELAVNPVRRLEVERVLRGGGWCRRWAHFLQMQILARLIRFC